MLQNHTILKAKTHQLRYYWYLEKSFFKHRKQSLHKNSRPPAFKKKSTPMDTRVKITFVSPTWNRLLTEQRTAFVRINQLF